jgi:hypothetical protein
MSQQRNEHHVRPRRRLRDRVQFAELAVGEPTSDLAAQFRQRAIGAIRRCRRQSSGPPKARAGRTDRPARPVRPPTRDPQTAQTSTMFGPGRNWHSATRSLNSSGVIQRFSTTSMRRWYDPIAPICLDNSPHRFNKLVAAPDRGAAADGTPPVEKVAYSQQALLPSGNRAYIGVAGLPAMAINGRRNKPFGPGGSTRRLHQSRNQGSVISDQSRHAALF